MKRAVGRGSSREPPCTLAGSREQGNPDTTLDAYLEDTAGPIRECRETRNRRKERAMPDPFDYVADDIEEDWPASVDWDTVVGLILEFTVAE